MNDIISSLGGSWEALWPRPTCWFESPCQFPLTQKKTQMFNSFLQRCMPLICKPIHILTWISESPNQEVTSFLRNQLVRQVALAFPTPGWEDMTITEGVIHVATRWDWNWQRKASLRTQQQKATSLSFSQMRVINCTHLELEKRNKQSPNSPYKYYYVDLPVAFFLGTRKLPLMDFFPSPRNSRVRNLDCHQRGCPQNCDGWIWGPEEKQHLINSYMQQEPYRTMVF